MPLPFIVFFALFATVSVAGIVKRVLQWRRDPDLFREMITHGLPPDSAAGRYWLRAMPFVPLFFCVGIVGDAQAAHFVNTSEQRSAWLGFLALAGLVALGGVFVELSTWGRLSQDERRRRAGDWQDTQRDFYRAHHPLFSRCLTFGRPAPASMLPWWPLPLGLSVWASGCLVLGGIGFLRSFGLV